jgi:hypothetical protein
MHRSPEPLDDNGDPAPETPTDEPEPTPVKDPPAEPDRSPYVVGDEHRGLDTWGGETYDDNL